MSQISSPQAALIGALLLAASPLSSTGQDVVINELMSSTTGTDTEFIELFNKTATPIDLTNWKIDVYNSNDETTVPPYGDSVFSITLSSGTIPAGGHFLLGCPEFQTAFSVTPDVSFPNESLPNNSFTMILRDAASTKVYAAFVTDGGTSAGGPFLDSPNDAGTPTTPDVSVGPDGTFMPAGYSLTPDGGTSSFILEFSPKPAASATPKASTDNDPPALLVTIPKDNEFLTTAPAALVLGFNEVIAAGTGSITLYNSSDDSVVEVFDINSTSGNVEIVGPDVGLAIGSTLPPGSYYVLVDATAIEDSVGNVFPGISDPTVWNFSVAAPAVLTSSGPYTEDFSGFVSLVTYPDGWTVEGADLTYDGDWGLGTTGGFRGNASVLGYQHSSSTGVLVKKLTVLNDTGAPIENLTVSYKGRVARTDQTRLPAYSVDVAGVTVPALAYSTSEADNSLKEASVSGLFIEAGATFEITWTSDRGLPSGGSRQIGISDVSVGVGATPLPPTVSPVTLFPETLTSNSIDVGSEVVDEGGDVITSMGFVFAETAVDDTPEIGETGVTNLTNGEAGVLPFFDTLSALTAGTNYSVRSYATNSVGTAYSDSVTFTTLSPSPQFTGTYQEPFDAFDGSFPAGWTGLSSGGVNNYAGDWGSGSAGGFRGGVSSPGVVGYQHTGSTLTLELKLSLINDTGATITDLNISYLGLAERIEQTRSPEWTVTLDGAEVPELAYSTLDGVDEYQTVSLTGLSIANGAEFVLSWSSDRGLTAGSSKQIGLGEVIVSTSPIVADPYDAWAIMKGLNGANSGSEDDAENGGAGDGIPNVLEFILNGDPLAVDPSILPAVSVDATDFIFTFNRSEDSIGAATTTFQWSTDLSFPAANDVIITQSGSPANADGVVVTVDEATTPDTVTVKVPRTNAPAGKIFGRLSGTRP